MCVHIIVHNILQNTANNLALYPSVFIAQMVFIWHKIDRQQSKFSSSNGTKLKIIGKRTKTRKQNI